jgi:transporter family protein
MNWLAWSLLSAFFAAVTAILAKLGVTAVGANPVDTNLATAVRTSVVVVFTWALALANSQPAGLRQFTGKTWLYLVLSGLATGLSWLCYFHALQVGEASRVAPIDKLSVVLVIVLATLFLGERLTWGKAIGAAMIAAGAIVIALD